MKTSNRFCPENGNERVAFLAERHAFFDYSVNFVFQSIAALFQN